MPLDETNGRGDWIQGTFRPMEDHDTKQGYDTAYQRSHQTLEYPFTTLKMSPSDNKTFTKPIT